MNNIGYCCIPLGCNLDKKKKDHIQVNRGMVRKTFDAKGLPYVSELVILNLIDTLKVLDWNIKNDIYVYRLSSDSFPWMSNFEFHELPNFKVIEKLLVDIGNKAKSNNIRLSLHPGPYSVLASENEEVVKKSIVDLERHAQIMDLMQLDKSTYYPINTHINSTKPTLELAAQRFCNNFNLLSDSLRKRLTIENDDSPNQYSVKFLYEHVHKVIGIPIVFDSFHHSFHTDGLSEETALKLAVSTWKTRPLCHHSSSKKLYEDLNSRPESHADFIYEKFNFYGESVDVELECKMKDLALFKYISDFVI